MAQNDPTTSKDEFSVTFKNGALSKLKELARQFGISDEQLGDVVIKGIKVIELAQDGKLILEKDNTTFEIDLKKI